MGQRSSDALNTIPVMIVDDQGVIRKALRRVIEKAGDFAFEEFPSARDAIPYLKSHVVELVVADIYMPQGDGFELLAYIRGRPIANDIPVIFVTGEATKDDIVRSADLGVTDYLVKPFEQSDLIQKVKQVLEAYRNPPEKVRLLRKAEGYLIREEAEAARMTFEEVLSLDPRSARAFVGLAQLEAKGGQRALALEHLRTAMRHNNMYFPAFTVGADLYIEDNNFEEAIPLLKAELAINGKRWERRRLLADCHLALGENKDALEQLRLAMVENPSQEELSLHMAGMQLKIGDFEKCLHYFLKTRRQNPQSKLALDGIINACVDVGQPQRAVRVFSDLLNLSPNQKDVLLARAHAFEKLADHEKALQDLDKILAADAKYAPALEAKGRIFGKDKRNDEALAIWTELTKVNPVAENFARAGLLCLRLEKYQDAASNYEKACQMSPGTVKYHFNLGVALEQLQQREKARACYERVLVAQPQSAEAREALARIQQHAAAHPNPRKAS